VDISGSLNVKNNGVNALVVVNGNVGLNNSNPQYTLDVSGIISTPSGIFITGTTNSPSIAFSNGGATGIGYVGFNGAYSSSANTGDLVIRSDVNKNLFLQSGTGGSAITIDSSNAVSVSLNFIGSDNVFNATAISNPLVKNGLARGTADGATLSSFNTAINSWYGTGFVDTCFKKCNCVINNRTGDITTNGAFGFSYTTMPTLLSNQIGYIYYEQNSSWTPAGTGFQRLTNINLSIGVWQVHANINFGNSPLAGLLLETYNAYTSTPGVTGAVTFFSASHDPGTGTGILASTNSRNTTGQPANMCASSVICVTTTGSGGNSNLAVVYYCETTAASKYTIRAVRIA
jgi:hypothetical protein